MVRPAEILNQDMHIRVLRRVLPLFQLLIQLLSQICLCHYNIILNEKQCSSNTLKVAFDFLWKVGICYGTTTNCYSKKWYATFEKTYSFDSRIFSYVYSFLQSTIFNSKLFSGFENPWTLDFCRIVYQKNERISVNNN